jgi:hypothetical protein
MGNQQFDRQSIISATTNKKILSIEGELTDILESGVYERITILSPKNTVSRLFNVIFGWDSNVTQGAGTRDCIVDIQTNNGSGLGMFKISNTYDKDCQYNQGWGWDGTVLTPSDTSAFVNQVHAVQFDDRRGVQMVFFHGYPYNTNSKRYWYLFVEQEVVAR